MIDCRPRLPRGHEYQDEEVTLGEPSLVYQNSLPDELPNEKSSSWGISLLGSAIIALAILMAAKVR